jgi:hypothetical protein
LQTIRRVRAAAIAAVGVLMLSACSGAAESTPQTYGAATAEMGQSQAILGWNVLMANLRFAADYVLIDVDAAPADAQAPRAEPKDLRFGLYGALAHPLEADGIGSCQRVQGSDLAPLVVRGDRVTGTVCLGPIRDQSQVRGAYLYSPRDRIPATTVAYAAAFPLGVPETNGNDTGLELRTTSAEAWREDGEPLTPAALGDPTAFEGNGYMLLGLQITGLAERYRDESQERGGPLMVVVAPSLPAPGLSAACSTYGASVLVLPEASMKSVRLDASLCTQGEINAAVLYPTVSVIGTHAALWTATAP